MRLKLFTLRFSPALEAFDDEGLRSFCAGKEILSVRDQFFVKDEVPYWGVMVTYNLPPGAGDLPAPGDGAEGEPAGKAGGYRALLGEEEWPLFNALRDWRAERAKAEGVPPYIVVTNDCLARLVRARPESLTALGQVRGFGPAKVKRYGRELLRELGAREPQGPAAPAPPATSGEAGEAGGPEASSPAPAEGGDA